MKKYSVIAMLLCLIISLVVFGGCEIGGNTAFGTHEGLSAELERRIRQDYLYFCYGKYAYSMRNIEIERYYGTYNGCVVVSIYNRVEGYPGTPGEDLQTYIDNVFFVGSLFTIRVWKEGRFYTLWEANELGLITREDLMSIAYINNGKELNLENQR